MSIDLNWDTLTTGPDGLELAGRIRDFIHSKFQAVPLPRFIKSVTVHEFEFGSIAPELELKDITDPLPDFYEESEEDEDGEDSEEGEDDGGDGSRSSSADEQREEREQRGHRHELSGSSLLSNVTARPEADARNGDGRTAAAAAAATASGGVPGGTSNLLHHFHSHLTPGWSGTQTPLAAMAGAHLNTTGGGRGGGGGGGFGGGDVSSSSTSSPGGGARPNHHRNPSYSSSISMGGTDSVPAAAVATSSSSSYSSAANLALLRPVLREKHSVSTLAPTSAGIPSRPPTRDAAMAGLSGGSGSAAAEETGSGKGRHARTEKKTAPEAEAETEQGGPRRPLAHRPHEPRTEDMQAVFRIRYAGDIKLLLTADILLDYPMPSFVGIPVRLSITGLTFDGVGVLAHIRKRIHFCFLGPEDALAAVGDDESDGVSGFGDAAPAGEDDSNIDDSSGDRATLASARFTLHGAAAPPTQPPPAAPPKPRTRVGGLLQEVRVESEIGQRQGGKQSLKNVGKVERFVLEQVRRIFEEEFVYPSFWTFLV